MRTDRIVFSLQIIWKSIIVTIYADTVGLRVVGTIVFSVSEILLILSKLVEFHKNRIKLKSQGFAATDLGPYHCSCLIQISCVQFNFRRLQRNLSKTDMLEHDQMYKGVRIIATNRTFSHQSLISIASIKWTPIQSGYTFWTLSSPLRQISPLSF